MMNKVYYFGCIGSPGHYMYDTNLQRDWNFGDNNPWGLSIDGSLCPKDTKIEGKALIHWKNGWTAVAFWDRSVDLRPNTNSAFLAEGTFSFKEMLEIANRDFPSVMKRFPFSIEISREKEGGLAI